MFGVICLQDMLVLPRLSKHVCEKHHISLVRDSSHVQSSDNIQGADSVLNTEIDSRQNVQPAIFGLGKRNIKKMFRQKRQVEFNLGHF